MNNFDRFEAVRNTLYGVMRARADVIAALCPKDPGKNDRLLCKMLEWGWVHHAPPGQRYRVRDTQVLTADLNMEKLVALDAEEALRTISTEVDSLIEKAKAIVTEKPVDQMTLQANVCPDCSVQVFLQIIFESTVPEPYDRPTS